MWTFRQESLFMLQLAHILNCKKHTTVRAMRVVEPGVNVEVEKEVGSAGA